MYDGLHFGCCLFINLFAQCPRFHNATLLGYMHGAIAVEEKLPEKCWVKRLGKCAR